MFIDLISLAWQRHLPALPMVPFAAARSSGPLLVTHLNKQPVDLAVVNGLLSHHQLIQLQVLTSVTT